MEKIINYIKNLRISASDIFLAVGFLFFVPFAAFSWQFMVTFDPSTLFLKNWMIIVLFIISFSCLCTYLALEIKKGNITNRWFFFLFIFFAIMSVVTVLVQPNHSVTTVICKNLSPITEQLYPGKYLGDEIEVVQNITPTHKLFFSFASLLITTIFYIILFVFAKRHSSFSFLIFSSYIVAIFIVFLTMYSYVFESVHYGSFFKALFSGDSKYIIEEHQICSFLVQRVPYGVCLMMSIMFFLLAHYITKQKWWILFGLYSYINLLISWCKTAILITTFILFLYGIFLLATSFKNHKKRNLIILIVGSTLVISAVILTLVSIFTNGKFLPKLYSIYQTRNNNKTLKTRTFVWENIRQQLSGGWIVIGRGFGTHNLMLYPMNLVNGDDVCPSHSTYYAILGAGGLISLIGFAGLFVYYIYALIKCWKIDKNTTIVLAGPVLAYMLYSFTEGVNYLWVAFMFPLIMFYNIEKNKTSKKKSA